MRKLLILIQGNTSLLTCETALVKPLSNHNPYIISFRPSRKQLLEEKKDHIHMQNFKSGKTIQQKHNMKISRYSIEVILSYHNFQSK